MKIELIDPQFLVSECIFEYFIILGEKQNILDILITFKLKADNK